MLASPFNHHHLLICDVTLTCRSHAEKWHLSPCAEQMSWDYTISTLMYAFFTISTHWSS